MAVKKGNGVSVMVWGCFGGKQKGTFVPFVVKSVNAKIYLRILETLVLPVIDHINQTLPNVNQPLPSDNHPLPSTSNTASGSSGARFQQDNAPVHKAKIIGQFFSRPQDPGR